jgi:regulator of nucleoside diphosphate kinase
MHRNAIIITQPDLLRLAGLLRAYLLTWPYLAALERQLRDAMVVRGDEVPADVVTMGSRFRFTDRRTGVPETYRLVYPEESDLDQGRLSVFAPIGTAVLGHRARQTVWWQVPWGLRVVRIDEVLFQPEANGRGLSEGDGRAGHESDPASGRVARPLERRPAVIPEVRG